MSRVRIASQLDDEVNALLRERLPEVEVLRVPRGLPRELPEGLLALLAAPDAEWRAAAAPPPGWPFGLGFVQLASSGLDAFPRWLFDGPPLASARGVTATSVAEFALAAIFAAAKQLPALWIDRAEAWRPRPLAALAGATLGLYGFGAIARELACKAQALDMRVLALRRSAQPFEVAGVRRAADLHELFADSDHLVLAAPASLETRHAVNRETLASARPGLHLINVARGSLVDQDALLQALDTGRLALASLDVAEPEPLPDGHPLYRHPRVRLSPHSASSTPQVYRNIAALLARNLERFQRGLPLENLVQAGA